ncbi:hypothetical protein Tdes44962_MAKER03301 [Teratosphaeria destructans]|uniref:Uncharacterized protein n=1 Tax=Teratosphaeria destructans TaxID=418781 RepID=A0A9W7SQL8_9PEZI|nr:hypothetical protein Tdes44962_MAKER03301 [Teratosphaeria destructans]
METTSPPISPMRNHMSPIDTSPTHSCHERLRRRTSSFSSNYSRSPISPRKHRFSDASLSSQHFHNHADEQGEGMGGLGNLADELDQLDDDYEEGDGTEVTIETQRGDGEQEEGTRDSGIDVSYVQSQTKQTTRNFSRPVGGQRPLDDEEEQREDRFTPELEDAITSIARMTSHTATSEEALIPRTVALLQDLGNQASLESGVQRLNTSTNSLTAHLSTQTKELQSLSTSLLSPFLMFSGPLDPDLVNSTTPLVEALLKDLPIPDTAAHQGLQKLERETASVLQTLSQLTDTLQIGKQITNTAARHLRSTQNMVADLRMEREKVELARHELVRGDMEEKIRGRWCASQCRDVVEGFERRCDELRQSLVGVVA